ncbi:MAG: hypothetical protein AAF609_23285 [Cyanobacteria bacterium P01_C01_bin.120]
MITPAAGKLANAVEAFAGEFLQEMAPPSDRGTLNDYIAILSNNPRAAAGAEVQILNLLQRMGPWTHSNENIQAFIDEQWAQMDGSKEASFAEMGTALLIGRSASEWALREPVDSKWWLESIILAPPANYVFEGQLGKIADIQYYPSQGINFPIEYDRIIHIVNRRHVAAITRTKPYGIANCRLAYAADKAWKIIINEMLIAGQRQATPIIFGKADNNERCALLKEDGTPYKDDNGNVITVPAPEKLKRELKSLNANGGVITGGGSTEIQAIAQQSDGRFFIELLRYLDRTIMLAFMVPFTTLEEGVGGLGNEGLAKEQLRNMRLQLGAIAKQIQEELTEKLIRPLIEWHFSEAEHQNNFGEWQPPDEEQSDRIELLNALTASFASGVYSVSDEAALNRHRELAGIPEGAEIAQAMTRPSRRYWKDVA